MTVLNADIRTLMGAPDIEAVLMLGVFAHGRYGGKPVPGEAQVLSTRGERGMPPWVVTTPPLAAHFEGKRREDGTVESTIVPDERMTLEDETYLFFAKVFQAVDEFNEGAREPKIRTLGCELEFLNMPQGDATREAAAARSAYLRRYGG